MHQTVAFSKHYPTHLLICSSVTRTPTLIIWCFFSSGTSVSAFIAFNTWQLFQEWNIGSAKYTPILPGLSPRYILCIYIYIYVSISMYTQSLQIQNGIVDGLAISISSVGFLGSKLWYWNWRNARGKSSNHPLSSPFLRPCLLKIILGKTKKRFTKLQALVNHL